RISLLYFVFLVHEYRTSYMNSVKVALGEGSNRIAQKLADRRLLKPLVRDSERVGSGGSRILPGRSRILREIWVTDSACLGRGFFRRFGVADFVWSCCQKARRCRAFNRMELLACIRALQWVRANAPWDGVTRVQVFTDSRYVKD